MNHLKYLPTLLILVVACGSQDHKKNKDLREQNESLEAQKRTSENAAKTAAKQAEEAAAKAKDAEAKARAAEAASAEAKRVQDQETARAKKMILKEKEVVGPARLERATNRL